MTCNVPGSAADATVLRLSSLYQRSAQLLPKEDVFQGQAIPFMLLGDQAYPSLTWILKGYTSSQGKLSREQEPFNVYHSSGRNVVEHTFGRLTGCWRVTLKQAEVANMTTKVPMPRLTIRYTTDEVLLWTLVRVLGLCRIFLHHFLGPYIVLEETLSVNYQITPTVPTTIPANLET